MNRDEREEGRSNIKPSTILLVEDDSNDVLLIERAFKKDGIEHDIQIVIDGMQAIDYLSGKGAFKDRKCYPLPELIILDIKMPRKSGHEFLEWLASKDEMKRIPVVVLSASDHPSDIERAYDLGANSYLAKPVSYADLERIVKAINLYWLSINERPEVR